ncbi:MAG: 2-phospho-L-lactate transferase [Solirubrobacteraceae bacterium]
MSVALLSGGTGGAKLARGLRELCELDVIANTGDDIEIYGAHVSPDPDLVSYWLADRIDERGWGLEGDTFAVMDGLRELGVDVWFKLGDRDLAVCLERRRLLESGSTLTAALAALAAALGLRARVVPMSDSPVCTQIRTDAGWIGLQEFLIRERGAAQIKDIRFDGVQQAQASPAALAAIAAAEVVVIGPSNPIISIGPMLALGELRDALAATSAPVVAVSPIVGGQVLKGPTAACMQWAKLPCNASGVAQHYDGLIDGLICDEELDTLPTLETSTLMDTLAARERVAGQVLEFARRLNGRLP